MKLLFDSKIPVKSHSLDLQHFCCSLQQKGLVGCRFTITDLATSYSNPRNCRKRPFSVGNRTSLGIEFQMTKNSLYA